MAKKKGSKGYDPYLDMPTGGKKPKKQKKGK